MVVSLLEFRRIIRAGIVIISIRTSPEVNRNSTESNQQEQYCCMHLLLDVDDNLKLEREI